MQWHVGAFSKDSGKFCRVLVKSHVFCLRIHVPAMHIAFKFYLLASVSKGYLFSFRDDIYDDDIPNVLICMIRECFHNI